ncbi:McrC family protein [Archaeoglobus sp.]
MKELKKYTGGDSSLRIDLKEWQDIGELPEFRNNPFLPVRTIPPEVRKYIDILDVSSNGVRIKAKNYVGIIPLSEEIMLTVSPKAPMEDFLYVLYKAQGRKVSIKELREMVRIGRKYAKEYPNIFHFLIYVLLVELEKIRSFGFLKKSKFNIQSKVIKGKLLVKESIKSWLKGNGSAVCGSFEMSKDNSENRAIKFTLWTLLSLYSPSLGKEIRNNFFEKYRWFEDVPLGKGIDFVDDVEEVITYRTLPSSRSYYYDILNLCMFFITHSTLEYKSPKEVKVKSFVVDMNKVFEEYIYNVLREKLNNPYEVKRHQKRTLFDNTSKYEIEPDYLILKNNKIKIIVDAKYKNEPTTDDFYQVLVYADRYNVTETMLVYPSWTGETYTESFAFKEKRVTVFYYDMLNVEKSERDLIATVMEK